MRGHLHQQVLVAHHTTDEAGNKYDTSGHPILTQAQARQARIVDRITRLVTKEGVEIFSEAHIFLNPDETLTPEAQITLPSGETPRIKQVLHPRDGWGQIHHTVVYI